MLEIADLHVYLRTAALGSVSAAARALEAPKSSVSRALVRLEESVGVPLFERSSRSVSLTEAGVLFQQHALRILAEVEEAESSLGKLAESPRGTLRISAPFAIAAALVAPMLPMFVSRYPGVRVGLDSDNRPVDLLAREADVAIRVGPLADSELVARRLPSIAMWLCASPAYLARRGAPKRGTDLALHDVLGRLDEVEAWALERPGRSVEQVTVHPRMMVSDPAAAVRVLEGGFGIGRLPRFVAAESLARGSLVRVLPRSESFVDAHALYRRHAGQSSKIRVFLDALVAHLTST